MADLDKLLSEARDLLREPEATPLAQITEEARDLVEKSFRVGTIRKWKGVEFQKQADQTWAKVALGRAKAAIPKAPPPKAPKKAAPDASKAPKKAAEPPPTKAPKAAAAAPAAAPSAQKAPEKPQKAPAPAAPKAKAKTTHFDPDPAHDGNGDGVADAARVGVPGDVVPPPPGVPRLPNLNDTERAIESKFADTFEENADDMANEFLKHAEKENWVFETDAAKSLMPEWTRSDLPPDEKGKPIHPERAVARALFNTALHQTANAVAKKAFLKRLDQIEKLPEDQRKVLVTSGGVAGGKGSALRAKPELARSVAATWDAAGEQNATENPWVMKECLKRKIKPVFLFVSADPKVTWPGAVERAKGIGRMVDARVFADSYAHGAKNFKAFHDKHKDEATFVFAQVQKGEAAFANGMDPAALSVDADELYKHASEYIDSKKADLPDYIHQGATAGRRIWG